MKTDAPSRRDQIRSMLADLKLPGALEAADSILAEADGGAITASHAIAKLLRAQIDLRNNRRLQAAMRSSRLPAVKTIDADWKVLVGAVQDGDLCTSWQYSLEKPADDWVGAGFDDSTWKSGLAPFASSPDMRTEWKSAEIHCRKTFEFDGGELKHAALVLRNNGRTDVWLNGEKILSAEATRSYQLHVLTEVLRDKLRKGTNTIALHSRKQRNATYLDLGILVDR